MDLTELNKQLSNAKIRLIGKRQCAFLAYAIMMLPTEFSDSISTGCTNAKRILLNPSFFAGLTMDEQQFLLAHEVMHCMLSHITRVGDRDPSIYNAAGDYVINDFLGQNDFTLIKGSLHDDRYHGMTTEEVYDLLIQEGNTPSNPMGGDIEYHPDNEDSAETQAEIDALIFRAALQADMTGASDSVPDSIRRYLSELSKPKVNWKVVLRKYLLALDRADYSWTKPRRKLLVHDMYLPALKSQALTKISFAIDTSGSIPEEQFNGFLSEVVTVFKQMKPKELDILQFDHELRYHETVKSLQQFQTIPFKGYGGTCPEVALEAVHKTNSKALFVITDGYFHTHDLPKPKQPVIWVIFDNPNFEPPFGSVIHVGGNHV